jgi:hypothetical protein
VRRAHLICGAERRARHVGEVDPDHQRVVVSALGEARPAVAMVFWVWGQRQVSNRFFSLNGGICANCAVVRHPSRQRRAGCG